MAVRIERVYSTTLESAATSITISSLTGNTDEIYWLSCKFVGGSVANTTYSVRFNNDSGTNYGQQVIYSSSTAGEGMNRAAETAMALSMNSVATNNLAASEAMIFAKSGYVRTALVEDQGNTDGTLVTGRSVIGQVWNNTVDEVTSLVILASQTNGIGVGSQIELYRKVTV